MKILHTADWHLGKRLERFPRMDEQRAVMDEICGIADREKVHAVIVAGDLFDTFNPSAEATELLYGTLKRLGANGTRAVIAIAGNHDSPDRIDAPDPLARECGIIFAGLPAAEHSCFKLESGLAVIKSAPGFIELNLPGCVAPLRVLLTPYANEYRFRTSLGFENPDSQLRQLLQRHWDELTKAYCDERGVNALAAHLYLNGGPDALEQEPDDEKPILHVGGAQPIYAENLPGEIQFAALGHLHRCQQCAGTATAWYSGTPLSYSFAESGQIKSVLIADIEPGNTAHVSSVPLTQGKKLVRARFDTVDRAVAWLQADENAQALVELTMVTQTYISADERRRIIDAHDGIVTIIPEVTDANAISGNQAVSIDLTKSISDLFGDFFKSRKGLEPSDDILSVFKEICAVDGEA